MWHVKTLWTRIYHVQNQHDLKRAQLSDIKLTFRANETRVFSDLTIDKFLKSISILYFYFWPVFTFLQLFLKFYYNFVHRSTQGRCNSSAFFAHEYEQKLFSLAIAISNLRQAILRQFSGPQWTIRSDGGLMLIIKSLISQG